MIDHIHALPEGYQLQEYTISGVLGFGGFGITYSARDNNLDKIVAIKEYLPSDLAARIDGSTVSAKSQKDKDSYDWGLDRFLDEARTVAKFNHPNIIQIYRFFEQNGTGYIVMDFIGGKTLQEELDEKGILQEPEIREWLWPVMEGLNEVHASGYLHRDIKPQNIMMTDRGIPILLDFGAARAAVGGRTLSLTSIMTPGYAPLEQYQTRIHQGPWTDIYALGAVMYRCVTGLKPDGALNRVSENTLEAPKNDQYYYSSGLLSGITASLALSESDRPQSLNDWLAVLDGSPLEPTRKMPAPRHEPTSTVDQNSVVAEERKSNHAKWFLTAITFLLVVVAVGYWLQNQVSEPFDGIPSTIDQSDESSHTKLQGLVKESQSTQKPSTSGLQDERSASEQPAEVEPVKAPYEGVRIVSEPVGVDVFIDNRFVGVSPLQLESFLPGHTATVKVRLADYVTAERAFTAPEEGLGHVNFTLLEQIKKLALTINTKPEDSTIKILNIGPKYESGILLEPGGVPRVSQTPPSLKMRPAHRPLG